MRSSHCCALRSSALAGTPLLLRSPRGLAQAPVSPLSTQSQEEADRKSVGCLSCHTQSDARTMHASPSVRLGCTDCHGGDAGVKAAGARGSRPYEEAQGAAHVAPRNRDVWKSAANPERSYTALLEEDLEFVRFVNPGDLRAAPTSCGPCHRDEVRNVSKSMMTHGGHALRGRPLQQRRPARKGHDRGRELRTGRPAPHPADRPRPQRGGDAGQGRARRSSSPSRAGSWARPGTPSESSSAAGAAGSRSGSPTPSRSRASPTRDSPREARGRSTGPIP